MAPACSVCYPKMLFRKKNKRTNRHNLSKRIIHVVSAQLQRVKGDDEYDGCL